MSITVDLSVIKKTEIFENKNVEFRAEFLNAFNHVLFPIGNGERHWRNHEPNERQLWQNNRLDTGELFAARAIDLEVHLLRSILKTPRL